MRPRSLASALLVLLLGACSKGQTNPDGPDDGPRMCTEMGCVDGLRLELAKATAWAPGSYVFTFALDGAPVTCSGSLPLKACEAGPSLTCDVPDRVQIGESGCALPPEQHGFSDIQIRAAPAKVGVDIARDGQPLGGAELTPTYVESRPNGPGCDPVCHGATARVELP
jgi:hypothetical protein